MNHEVAEPHERGIHLLPRTTTLTLAGLQGLFILGIAPAIQECLVQGLGSSLAALLCDSQILTKRLKNVFGVHFLYQLFFSGRALAL